MIRHGYQRTGKQGIGIIDGIVSSVQGKTVNADAKEQTSGSLSPFSEPVAKRHCHISPKPHPKAPKTDIQIYPKKIIVNL